MLFFLYKLEPLHKVIRSNTGLYVQRGIGEAASRKSAAEYANEIQYCDVAHIDACHIRDSEEAAFKILGQFMKAAESSPLGSFEQTSVVSEPHACFPACVTHHICPESAE